MADEQVEQDSSTTKNDRWHMFDWWSVCIVHQNLSPLKNYVLEEPFLQSAHQPVSWNCQDLRRKHVTVDFRNVVSLFQHLN